MPFTSGNTYIYIERDEKPPRRAWIFPGDQIFFAGGREDWIFKIFLPVYNFCISNSLLHAQIISNQNYTKKVERVRFFAARG